MNDLPSLNNHFFRSWSIKKVFDSTFGTQMQQFLSHTNEQMQKYWNYLNFDFFELSASTKAHLTLNDPLLASRILSGSNSVYKFNQKRREEKSEQFRIAYDSP